MTEFKAEAPLKVLSEDFKNFEKVQESWVYKINEECKIVNVNKVLIQGEIVKTAGFSKEILIINDKTGKIKVTVKSQVPGDLSWLNEGIHCSIVGTLLEKGKLPSISADKIAKITNTTLQEMWPWEVKELKNVLTKKTAPRLPELDVSLEN